MASLDDEDVSLDELLISDSSDEEEEEEATEVRPGLSEAELAAQETEAQRSEAAHEAEAVESEASADQEVAATPEPAAADRGSATEPAVAEGAADEGEPAAAAPEEIVIIAEEAAREERHDDQADDDSTDEPAAEDRNAEERTVAVAEPRSAPLNDEPTRPDASPVDSEILDVAPESEAEVLSSDAIEEAVLLEPDGALEAEPSAAAELELDETAEPLARPEIDLPERKTLPETIAAKRRDAPLPSFEIPELEAVSAASVAAPEPARRAVAHAVALPPLSEVGEDDDDAVTHMGLPTVPEAANDYPAATHGFQVADPGVAALQSIDADIARGDSRRATTRVIPRVDPKSVATKPRIHALAVPPLLQRLSVLARDTWGRAQQLLQPASAAPLLRGEADSSGRRLNWALENVLPPLSLVLFGSGLGAGVIMLVEKDAPEEPATKLTVQALHDSAAAPRVPTTLADRARAGDGEALYKITNMPQDQRTSALTIALEAGYQAQKLREFRAFAQSLAPVSRALPAASVTRMVEYATSPETMLPAFEELTQWAGPAGPDVLYAVWEKAAGGSRAASLAQQLLYSADQRAKATPALLAALDLRSAASCDDYLKVLPAVAKNGDQRSSATLRALRHDDGCGADGKQDCYACLRDSSLLEDALKAVEPR